MMKILVSGGLGYIGSHTVVELLNNNYEVLIIDNLENTNISVHKKIKEITGKNCEFIKGDVCNLNVLEKVFANNHFGGIIHFAGYKAVGESVMLPLKYYYNNLVSTINLAKMAQKYNIAKFIFSSSATVYGDGEAPFTEESPLLPRTNPYGETKAMNERILIDAQASNKSMSLTLLRYFNPIGAHPSTLIGEVPKGIPNNLMPYVTQVAKGMREKLYIFGNDYPTVDGTGVRDFIHVVDLAKGHVAALKSSLEGVNIYNLGTGRGTSVLELVNAFMRVNNIEINYEFAPRRTGDIATSYANCDKARRLLNWQAKLTIEDMVRDAWNFEAKLN